MTDEPLKGIVHSEDADRKHRRVGRWAVIRSVAGAITSIIVVGGLSAGLLTLYHPETPLPPEWNFTKPLSVSDPVTPLTMMKLRAALSDPVQCRAVLGDVAQISVEPPLAVSENCYIRNRIEVSGVGQSKLEPLETACATALRTAMWEYHGLQPAAAEILDTQVTAIRHIGSYNCRPIRTTQGTSNRWSTHATADAIDVTGFDFADGRSIRLIRDWDDDDAEAKFLRAARDTACTWFATTLGPDYNDLHADHFHLQSRGRGTCR